MDTHQIFQVVLFVHHKLPCICRYVVCSWSENEQNLVAFQQGGRILFRCCRSIYPGQELKVWYAEEYAQSLSTTWDKIWDKKCTPIGNLPFTGFLVQTFYVNTFWWEFANDAQRQKIKLKLICSYLLL